ncbi:LysR family transcriptional regulator [Paraburkholderia humisilvae]|uniref:HTH-type transcriptional regulator DmlR n=1 Tax=Paraburkholderia humisilvae TaxID=627669 RepID=A0A6J5EMU8_9BURK|nr:LysR family transcriptional regulator [Paraburkholderia humisilvae]CAB3766576.1 HTH-type transcriptional regulator DmlR [Paraburkholderia humisilvae]
MNQIHAMRVFVRVAETQSFRRAAQQLNVSNALVTRSIATLEAHLHARLINRTTRNLSLTEAGAHYLEGCRGLLEELDHLDSAVACTEREPGGLLRVVAAGALAPQTLARLVDGFHRRHPKIGVRLALAEQLARLPDNGYDVGIVTAFSTANAELDLAETPLATQSLVACASAAYLDEHGALQRPDELAHHACVALPSERRSASWRFVQADGSAHTVTIEPVFTVNSAPLVRLAALAGMGVAVLPAPLVAGDLAAGTLAHVLPDCTIDDPHRHISLVYPRRRHLNGRTRAFVDFALEQMSAASSAAAAPHGAILADLHVVPHA